MYVDLTLSVQEGVEADGGLYLDKAYLREDEGGSYVMKVSRENRWKKPMSPRARPFTAAAMWRSGRG